MSKELFVSSTPHETKVAIVEDDQLAEIYFERENEYTLAGSIYKGRVNRVLPGMQSAFVDLGLERDAFLYVSDFFEDQEEYDTIAGQAEDDAGKAQGRAAEPGTPSQPRAETGGIAAPAGEGQSGDREPGSRRWRGRRRRGGRGRGPGSGPQEPQSSRPDSGRTESGRSESRRPEARPPSRPQPPADYEPMVLPGESISKYRNRGSRPEPVSGAPAPAEPSAIEPVEAAPISQPAAAGRGSFEIVGGYEESGPAHQEPEHPAPLSQAREVGSEERRVGKECTSWCRSRWSPYH